MSIIGTSVLGKNIPVVRFGTGSKEVFYCAATHANEWITSPLLMKFLENLSKSYVNGVNIFGQDARELFSDISLYIAPMVNPDGIDLVTGLITPGSRAYNFAKRISDNFPDIPFPSGWKANIEGVDLKSFQPQINILKSLCFQSSQGFLSNNFFYFNKFI